MDATSQPIGDLIEEAGCGRFQLLVLLLARGVWLCDGVVAAFASFLTPYVGQEIGISDTLRAFVVSMVYVGFMIGNGLGGYIGDKAGRRLPILLSYACICLSSLACACVTNLYSFAILWLFLGISVGVGLAPSLALVNETTPKAWRLTLSYAYPVPIAVGFGYLLVTVFFIVDDPTLEIIHWRGALVLSAMPPLLLGIIAYFMLHDSPLLLAKIGRRQEALGVLKIMFRQNGSGRQPALDSTLDAVETGIQNDDQQTAKDAPVLASSWAEQLRIVFGPKYGFTTFMLVYCAISANFVVAGTSYALPQILEETQVPLAPGWQLFVIFISGILLAPCSMYAAHLFVPRVSLAVAHIVMVVSVIVFALTEGSDELGQLQRLLYYAAPGFIVAAVNLMAIMTFFLAVESYPTVAAATAAAITAGGGRLGSIIAPPVLELMPGSTSSFYLMALLCAIGVVIVLADRDPEGSNERTQLFRK